MIKDIDAKILTMAGAGNQRKIEISIRKGELKIDGKNDRIIFEMESRKTYSEPGIVISDGDINISTQKIGKLNVVNLTRYFFQDYNITYNGKDEIKTITQSSVSYDLKILNKGPNIFQGVSCTTGGITICPEIAGFSEDCVDVTGTTNKICEYISDRVTIDFELI